MPSEVDYRRRSRSPKRHRDREKDYKDRDRKSERDRQDRHERDRHERDDKHRHDKHRHSSHRRRHSPPQSTSLRRRPYQYWDVAPQGYEHVTPNQYKAMQQIGQIPIDAGGAMPLTTAISATGSTMSRQARRIYVGGIPFKTTEDELMEMFNRQMKTKGYSHADGNPIIAVQINVEKNYAFLEFRSSEETTAALAFDGIALRGQPLKLRRPRDYLPVGGCADPDMDPLMIGDSPNKVCISGLPTYLTDDQVKELLISFGPLSSFNLVLDPETRVSKGTCYCEYVDPASVDKACAGLNAMTLGDKTLTASRPGVSVRTSLMTVIPQVPGYTPGQGSGPPTEVLCLMNMVTVEDIVDLEEYEDIIEDIKNECGKFGEVMSIQIPRALPGRSVPGIGKVFVEFASLTDCQNAQLHLSGRKFMDRVVVTSYFDLTRYRNRHF